MRSNTQEFIKKAREIHGNKYDYSKVEYVNCYTPITIICPIHGEFRQAPTNHLCGKGCPSCSRNKKMTQDEFLERATKVHGGKYDYSKAEYNGYQQNVTIICPIHGEFQQPPCVHLFGHGCPKCRMSKLEEEVDKMLRDNNIEAIHNASSNVLPWIGRQHVDFYLPKHNIAIECQGIQHYVPRSFGSKDKELLFKQTIERDKRKQELCEENNVKLIYYSHEDCAKNAIKNNKDLLKVILS